MATRLRIAPITDFPSRSAGAAIEAEAQSSASQTFRCDYMEASDPGLCWSVWDTLDVPTYRHRAFAAYQSGRQFDPELLRERDRAPRDGAQMAISLPYRGCIRESVSIA
jgi:hypothetical protein